MGALAWLPRREPMSAQTQKLIAAMPGTLPELIERTGYPIQHVLAFITKARVEGKRIAVRSVDGVATFVLDTPPEQA